jgi:molybdenum cofactor cytidylyltransferase
MSGHVSAVVLAAGMATRMGAVKQLLPFRGKTVLEQVLDTLRASEVQEIVVVLGFAADAIRARVPLHGINIVTNDAYREGMASSLRTGISAVDPAAAAALIVLADQPLVQTSTINRLIAGRDSPIAIPVYNGMRGNPVLIGRSLFPEVLQLSGDTGCRALFSAHAERILRVPVEDPGILIDFDTKQDLNEI